MRIPKTSIQDQEQERNWKNPFGDGRAGERIVEILVKK
jgi:UDP-N-acetylglucosamine 2-epimerase